MTTRNPRPDQALGISDFRFQISDFELRAPGLRRFSRSVEWGFQIGSASGPSLDLDDGFVGFDEACPCALEAAGPPRMDGVIAPHPVFAGRRLGQAPPAIRMPAVEE